MKEFTIYHPEYSSSIPIPPSSINNIYQAPSNISSNIKTNWKWDPNVCGTGIEIYNNGTGVWLKEAAYMFRTVIGDTPFMSGVHYWEIIADERTENELKIGISTKKDFNANSAFCDYEYGYAYYGLGQLRHNSNASGPQFG